MTYDNNQKVSLGVCCIIFSNRLTSTMRLIIYSCYSCLTEHLYLYELDAELFIHWFYLSSFQFRHTVLEVDPVDNRVEKEDLWKVTVRDDVSGQLDTQFFSAIMSCNGYV